MFCTLIIIFFLFITHHGLLMLFIFLFIFFCFSLSRSFSFLITDEFLCFEEVLSLIFWYFITVWRVDSGSVLSNAPFVLIFNGSQADGHLTFLFLIIMDEVLGNQHSASLCLCRDQQCPSEGCVDRLNSGICGRGGVVEQSHTRSAASKWKWAFAVKTHGRFTACLSLFFYFNHRVAWLI